MRILLFEVKGFHGTKDCDVAKGSSDEIIISGLKTPDGDERCFVDKAYELTDWADKNKFPCIVHDINLNLDTNEVIDWHKWRKVK